MLQRKKKISDIMIFRRILRRIPAFLYIYKSDGFSEFVSKFHMCGRTRLTLPKHCMKNLSIIKDLPYIKCTGGSLLLIMIPACGVYDCAAFLYTCTFSVIGSNLISKIPALENTNQCKSSALRVLYTLCRTESQFVNFLFYKISRKMLRILVFSRVSKINCLMYSLRSESN